MSVLMVLCYVLCGSPIFPLHIEHERWHKLKSLAMEQQQQPPTSLCCAAVRESIVKEMKSARATPSVPSEDEYGRNNQSTSASSTQSVNPERPSLEENICRKKTPVPSTKRAYKQAIANVEKRKKF